MRCAVSACGAGKYVGGVVGEVRECEGVCDEGRDEDCQGREYGFFSFSLFFDTFALVPVWLRLFYFAGLVVLQILDVYHEIS